MLIWRMLKSPVAASGVAAAAAGLGGLQVLGRVSDSKGGEVLVVRGMRLVGGMGEIFLVVVGQGEEVVLVGLGRGVYYIRSQSRWGSYAFQWCLRFVHITLIRVGGGCEFAPPPLWFFLRGSKTKNLGKPKLL